MAKTIKLKKFVKHVEVAAIIIVALFLAIYLITVISASQDFYTDAATKNAAISFDKDMQNASGLAEAHYDELYKVVDELRSAKTSLEVEAILATHEQQETFTKFFYFNQQEARTANGVLLGENAGGRLEIWELAGGNQAGCTAIYREALLDKDCVAFFVPVRGSMYIDGLVSVVPLRDVIDLGDVIQENTSAVMVVDQKGDVLSGLKAEGFTTAISTNLFDFIDTFTQSKSDVDSIRNLLTREEQGCVTLTVSGDEYTVIAEPVAIFGNDVYLLTLSNNDDLVTTAFDYQGHITFILIMAIIALVVGVTCAVVFRKRASTAVEHAVVTDSNIECASAEGFKKNALSLLRRNPLQYAVVVLNIKQFGFIENKCGASASNDMLKYVRDLLIAMLNENETFGYAGNGTFLLLSDFRNETMFRNRLLVFEGVINKYDLMRENQIKVQLAAGVYPASEGKTRSINDMIEYASVVCEEAKNNANTPCVIFTEAMREKINHNELMEARMEAALENNEFRLFLQPKYNVANDQIDSAEALVRWFDHQKGDYRFPAEFISLFEANGFIVKMDHFIYLEVLKYLNEAKARGDKIVPISVNVSRVTAASADFVNFYVGNKNRYMIDDNLITLEFTETYAAEDYQRFAEIVDALHKGGIRCSIDDFGVGYSSFRVLKELPMDELKLDRLFLAKGFDTQRDDKIIATITELAEGFGMTVVLEGVENKEMFDYATKIGIGVIQGYYYAKAISLEEFKIFIKSNTSIRYKSVVK